jgi:hypothetical protein
MSAYQIQEVCKLLYKKKKKKRKVAELCIEVKQKWQVEEIYTLPVTASATGVISHIQCDVVLSD